MKTHYEIEKTLALSHETGADTHQAAPMYANYEPGTTQGFVQIAPQRTQESAQQEKRGGDDREGEDKKKNAQSAVQSGLVPSGLKNVAEYLEFTRWTAMPHPEKKRLGLETEKAFGEYYEVHPSTLSKWKRRKDFWQHVDQHRSSWGKMRTADVLMGLYQRAVKYGMAQEVELWLAYFEGWDKKQVIEDVTQRFAADDIRQLIARLPEAEQEKHYDQLAQLLTDVTIHERTEHDGRSKGDAQDVSGQ